MLRKSRNCDRHWLPSRALLDPWIVRSEREIEADEFEVEDAAEAARAVKHAFLVFFHGASKGSSEAGSYQSQIIALAY